MLLATGSGVPAVTRTYRMKFSIACDQRCNRNTYSAVQSVACDDASVPANRSDRIVGQESPTRVQCPAELAAEQTCSANTHGSSGKVMHEQSSAGWAAPSGNCRLSVLWPSASHT